MIWMYFKRTAALLTALFLLGLTGCGSKYKNYPLPSENMEETLVHLTEAPESAVDMEMPEAEENPASAVQDTRAAEETEEETVESAAAAQEYQLDGSFTRLEETVTVLQDVNLRSKPNTSSQILGSLKKGTKVLRLGTDLNGWCAVVHEGKLGYVFNLCLSNGKTPAPAVPDQAVKPEPAAAPERPAETAPQAAVSTENTSEVKNPDIQNPDVQNPDIQNPDTQNPDVPDPNTQNPDPQNPDVQNPDIQNPDTQNPDTQNPDTQNPDAQDPDPQNPDVQNPDIPDPNLDRDAIVDLPELPMEP